MVNSLIDGRVIEIFEQELVKGWTAEKITGAGVEVKTVKTTKGKVARIYVTSAINVTLRDNTTDKWSAINNTTVDFSNCPIQCNTSIKLSFSGAGDAWIIYR